MRRLTLLVAVLLLVLGIAAACGDDGNDAASTTTTAAEPTTTTTSAPTTTTTTPTTPDAGSTRFVFALADGSLNIDGDATSCSTPSDLPGKIQVTFKGETAQVTIAVTGGKGTADVIGATQFDGTVTSVEVGANGEVTVSGTGTLAGAGSPVGFTVTGSCA
jgi:hypothetical protein